ncbi:CubicO group peptidase (beta-lactamase class C family) [Kibdelosporangium banguiense]|uniref:CubicO group peptidase (Beta-lactamase class C family) n=1 Tax=Kibdelosporangium banguiense TaxID=1365924 RepID=A0ABS4TJT4_9PSEU|nr:serine hydrolase domain-containing protein [Kibdelosporangium banguiense]MBP2324660.1 CubicO group peptidase (beta-lactamase class C family) [Kibdelosporangium banguiense]
MQSIVDKHVGDGTVPGALGLVARGTDVRIAVAGDGIAPDSIFRIASITKPITAAAVMLLIQDGRIALTDPIRKWLPELAEPMVVRTADSPVDDVVPAERPIIVFDLLTFRAGYGFPDRFDLPAVQLMATELGGDGREVQRPPKPDEWMAKLARVPLVCQPGEQWLYNTSSDLQGVLIARVSGQSLPDFLADRVFAPLGMLDTGFSVPTAKLDRVPNYYRHTQDGFELADRPDGQWATPPAFPSGAGGLVSTASDWLAFARMLLADGGDLLSAESVRMMTTDHLTAAQRAGSTLFLEGQGWGFGGSVDVAAVDPWNVPGRYGWVGGTGTAGHIIPSTGTATILFTQVAMAGPTSPPLMRDFWRYAAG